MDSDTYHSFRRFWFKFYNGGLWEFVYYFEVFGMNYFLIDHHYETQLKTLDTVAFFRIPWYSLRVLSHKLWINMLWTYSCPFHYICHYHHHICVSNIWKTFDCNKYLSMFAQWFCLRIQRTLDWNLRCKQLPSWKLFLLVYYSKCHLSTYFEHVFNFQVLLLIFQMSQFTLY